MPLQDHMKLISTDDHVVEHRNVWQDRIPQRLRDRAPVIREVDSPNGGPRPEVWFYEERPYPNIALNAVAGKSREEYGVEPIRYDGILPGCYDPAERVKDLDLDGIQAQLCFPTFPRFSGTTFLEAEDKELARLCVQAYNDFMIDEWCGAAPDRFIPLVILPLWDTSACVGEIERTAAKSAKAISFVENPVPLGLPSFHTDHWDGVFGAAQHAEMPLCMHFGTSGAMPITAPDAPFAIMITLMGCNSMYCTADLLFSPVFHKFPGLKVALSEGGIGWVPYLLERADYTWERHRYYTGINQENRPSELFADHVWTCFIDDEAGLELRHRVGVDNITWECDYPHSDSNWPHARKRTAEMLRDVPDDEAHKIAELNARQLFHFDADL